MMSMILPIYDTLSLVFFFPTLDVDQDRNNQLAILEAQYDGVDLLFKEKKNGFASLVYFNV